MRPSDPILTKGAEAWTLAAYAVAGVGVSYFSMVSVALFHHAPPVALTSAFMLSIIMGASERRRWLYLAVGVASYCFAGYIPALVALGGGMAPPIAFDLANLAGVLAAYGLIRRFCAGRPLDFARPRDLAWFGLSAGLVAPTVTMLAGWVSVGRPGDGGVGLVQWWTSDCLGMLVLAPGLLMLRNVGANLRQARVSRAGLLALAVLALVTAAAFYQRQIDLRYMVPPALALVVIYMEFAGVAVGGLIVAAIVTAATFAHHSSLAQDLGAGARTQLFLAFVMIVNLPFAGLLVQRRRLQESLISTRMEAEAARADAVEQQRRSAMAQEIAKVGFWRADFRTGEVQWSDQNYAIFDRPRSEPLSLDAIASYVHPDDTAIYAQAFSRMRRGRPHTCAWRAVLGDGQIRHVVSRGIPQFDAGGGVCGAFGTVSDVTELTLAQEALAKSAAHLHLITENIADIIVETDLDDRITYISPSIMSGLGYTPEEVLGAPWISLIHPEDAPIWLQARQQQLAANGEAPAVSIRCRARVKDGQEIWLGMRPTLLRDEKTGEPVGMLDVARDITESRRLVAELQAAREAAEKAAAVKGEFLANMSHEIRTPLTSISGFTRLVQTQPDLNEDTRRYIGHISSATSALLAIVNDVLDFSKLEAGEIRIDRRPTAVDELLQDMADLFGGQCAEKKLSLTSLYPADAPARLMVDPDRLRQILINLAGNAIKFTDNGGVGLIASYDAGTARLRVEVTDTGPGMPADQLGSLFQRFSQIDGSNTRRFGGTGLGLAICKGLAEAMGGEIGVTSELGAGSCFWFSIPAPPAEASSEPPPAEVGDALLDGMRVLVVDDNAVNRELVRAVLIPFGVVVTEAEDGPQAIEEAACKSFDAILMDLRMPGMSGVQATRAIADGAGPNAATPIIAFSADSGQELDAGLLAAQGFAGRVIKPFKPMDLVLALAAAADAGASAREVA
jgi:PAS domain S-box-containing protein